MKHKKKASEEKNHEQKKSEPGLTTDANILKKIKWSYVILAFIILIGFYGTFFFPNPMKTPWQGLQY